MPLEPSPAMPETGAPQTPPEQAAPSAPPAEEAPAAHPAPTEPDFDALIKRPEYRQRLLSHPELQTEFQRHRSEGGRRAKQELEAYQRQVREWYEQQQLARQKDMDPYELGEQRKAEIAEQERRLAEGRLMQDAQTRALVDLMTLLDERAARLLDP